MNKKILIYIVVISLTVLGLGVGVYFKKDSQPSDGDLNNAPSADSSAMPESDENTPLAGGSVLAKDDFSINVPQGWEEVQAPTGALALVINAGEQSDDPAIQKINFKSYFSVSYDSLQDKSKEEYIEYVKGSLEQISATVNFTENKQATIGGKEAQVMEIEITQQEINFKVLVVLFWGEGEDVWVVGLNTTKDKWDEYKSLFYELAGTFQIKK